MANGTLRAVLMVLTAATGSYAAGATILPALVGSGRNNGSFLLTVSPPTLTITLGESASSTISLISVNGFTGRVAVSAVSTDGSLQLALQNSTLELPTGGTATTDLTVAVPASTTNGIHDVIVTGTGTGHKKTFSSSALISVQVVSTANFNIYADPSFITNIQGSTSTISITLTSLNGFTGDVTLTATIPFGFIAVMGGQNPVTLPANGTASSTLQISTGTSTLTGIYEVTVTGTSGSNSYSKTITITVTKPVVEALILTSRSFSSPTNLTLHLQNTGDVPITLQAYTVRDSLGNAWTLRNWAGPTIPVNAESPANILISLDCLECTYTGIFGLFNQFAVGRTYTLVLTAESTAEFNFTVTW